MRVAHKQIKNCDNQIKFGQVRNKMYCC